VKRYRRIEITAFRRRVTIVSGAATPDIPGAQPAQTGDGVRLSDSNDPIETVELESAEGQLILVEAVRLLESQLSSQTGERPCHHIPAARWPRLSRRSFAAKLRALKHFITRPPSRPLPHKEK